MPIRHTAEWHKSLYDDLYAKTGLDSKAMHSKAKREILFLLKVLNLKPGLKVLDVPCGTGRHAKVLAAYGMDVTGVDISPACLKLATKNCGTIAKIRRGNMRELRWAQNRFDLSINMFTSFGYFPTDTENKAVMRSLVGTLKKGGHLVIQNLNRDWLMTIFDPARWGNESGYFWLESNRYDSKTKYIENQRIVIQEGSQKAHRSYHRIRLYSVSEMVRLMRECGLKQVKVFGGFDGADIDPKRSSHPIYVGTR